MGEGNENLSEISKEDTANYDRSYKTVEGVTLSVRREPKMFSN